MSSQIYRDIELKRQRSAQQFEPRVERYLAMLVRFNGNLLVPNRSGYAYAQQLPVDDAPPPVPVLCVDVQAREGLRVWIEKNREGEWEVVSWWRGITSHGNYNGYAYLPLHGRDHEWPRVDAVNVYPRSLTPLRCYPGEGGGLTVSVAPLRYILDGAVTLFPGELAFDLSGSQPAVGLARFVGVYLDLTTNAIASVDGATALDVLAVDPPAPTFPDDAITSALVRLDGSQTAFSETDFVDVRMIIGEATGRSDYDDLQEQILWVENLYDVELSLHMTGV